MRREALVLLDLVADLPAPIVADDLRFDDLSTLLGSLCVRGCSLRFGLLLGVTARCNHVVIAILVFEIVVFWTEGFRFVA